MDPKYSVIIPCHNSAEMICGALDSVRSQSFPAHEVIVINDRSTDASAERVRTASVGLPLRLFEVDLGNAAATRNVGIDAATGDWLAFLDADNFWYQDHLEQARACLAHGNDVGYMAYPGQAASGDQPRKLASAVPVVQPTGGLSHEDFVRFRLRGAYGFPTTGQVLRTDVVRAVGGFDRTQVRRHDFELFMRVIHSRTWTFNPRPTWWSRPPRPGNISADDVKCRYYSLRALTLNAARYNSAEMHQLLATAARVAVSSAISEGSPGDVDRAWVLAEPYLRTRDRRLLSAARKVPAICRLLRGRKRRTAAIV